MKRIVLLILALIALDLMVTGFVELKRHKRPTAPVMLDLR
jgi:hypothetical protein